MGNMRKPAYEGEIVQPNHKGGRGKVEINWELVDKMLISGCNGHLIAKTLGIHPNTLYDKIENEKGMYFQQYKQSLMDVGNDMLQQRAYSMAMKGDRTLLIFLLKARCGMAETVKTVNIVEEPKIDTSNLTLEEKKTLMEIIEKTLKKDA